MPHLKLLKLEGLTWELFQTKRTKSDFDHKTSILMTLFKDFLLRKCVLKS